jgi:hypothetical protein
MPGASKLLSEGMCMMICIIIAQLWRQFKLNTCCGMSGNSLAVFFATSEFGEGVEAYWKRRWIFKYVGYQGSIFVFGDAARGVL